jgi:hypothetical protein
MRPIRARWHDGDHNRSGRAAAGMVGPLHCAPVDAVFAGPRRVMPVRLRRCNHALPAGALMPEAHTHITMITLSTPAGQGLKLWASGTYGHSAPPSPAASVPVGAENHVTCPELVFQRWTGRVSSTFGCASISRPGTVGGRDPTLHLPGIAAPARLDSPVCTVRSGQRRRDLDLAPPDRRAPAPRQSTQADLGRPGDPVRADPAAPAPAPQPASPDRLAAYAAALARSHRQAPLVLLPPLSWTSARPANCPRSGAGNGA